MKKNIISAVSFLILVSLVGWYLSDPSRRTGLVEQISAIGLANFIWVTLGMFGFILFQGFVLHHSVSPYGVKLSFIEHFGVIIVTFFANYIIPFLGFGVRGVYLKRKHDLAYKYFSQSLIGVLVIEWSIFALIAVIAAGVLYAGGHPINVLLVLLMVGILAGFILLFVIRPSYVPNALPLSGIARSVLTDWQYYINHKKALTKVTFYTFLEAICFAFAFVVAYKALFPAVPPAAGVFASSLSDLSLIIRILPASAGSLEAALQMAMSPYGLSFSDNLSIALITRAAMAVIFLPLGPFFFWWLLIKSGVRAAENKKL